MKKHLSQTYNVKQTPQTEVIPGKNQVRNSAGGFSFEVSDWAKLDRFLILGTEGGSYYVSENKMTKDNCDVIVRLLQDNGKKVVDRIIEISDEGRAPKNDYALFAFALATKFGDEATRQYAYENLHKVARIGTHLFHFAEYRESLGGWGRGVRNAVSNWYVKRDIDKLAHQLVKYRQRDGWTHKDLLRLAHPHTDDVKLNNLFKWVVEKKYNSRILPNAVKGFIKLQKAKDGKEAAKLIREYELTREAVPTELLSSTEVWEALLEKMPMTAMIRNLANMTRTGLLTNFNDNTKHVVKQIVDRENLKNARVHPIQILAAMMTYKQGQSDRDTSKTWTVIPQIMDALDEAFDLSFEFVEPTGKRQMLALDVSGSMSMGCIAGIPGLTPRVASAALAMVTARVEQDYMFKGFSSTFMDLNISKRQRLDDVVKVISDLPFAGTDCSLPMTKATKQGWKLDAFLVYTDSETFMGHIHPCQALDQYRQKTGIDAKLVVVGMVSNGFTIADPKNPNMLDVVGFDTNTPAMISEFIRS